MCQDRFAQGESVFITCKWKRCVLAVAVGFRKSDSNAAVHVPSCRWSQILVRTRQAGEGSLTRLSARHFFFFFFFFNFYLFIYFFRHF